MKTTSIIAIGIACAAGVFAALQADRWLSGRESNPTYVLGAPPTAVPASFESGGGPVDFRAAAKKVLPSVVSVDRYDRVDSFFSDNNTVQETGQGSGVILSSDGLIVTNNHVVNGAADVQVRLYNKKSLPAKVLGTDSRYDIAVLKVNAKGLTPIELGDSTGLAVGQWVIAVGNPLGFDETLSAGVVSSLGRSLRVQGENLTDAIQTDAAINPGNSGGALCDAEGHLVGINAAIAGVGGGDLGGGQEGSIGIGFAIPVDRVKSIVSQIVRQGFATSAGLGIGYDPRYTGVLQFDNVREQLDQIVGSMPPSYGIIVTQVQPGGAADKAGIKVYDVLLAVDNVTTDAPLALNQVLNDKRPGDRV
ncbi:MAG TPA: trypsin-like peptidase domain-containing protein, partial [Fimbriimonadaceae bacterium]|nr:trypsin-like peptidase domain-containing protein [Fimbriimonadaceae bacterium]